MQTETTHDAPGESRVWVWAGAAFERAEGLPITDRGFRYGMSVFESFPLREGVGIFLEKHLTRLQTACDTVGFTTPSGAFEACAALLKDAGGGFARIYVTAGDGSVTGACEHCRVLVLVEERKKISAATYHRGYDLAVHPGDHVPVFGGVKTGNYWANLRPFREGVAARCNETLLFTPAGLLISACMANVFVVTGGRVTTPALGTGARAGVMREWVMERLEVAEALLTRAGVEAADEIFLTSSWLGIMPAASIAGRPLRERGVSGPLLDAYRREVG